MSDRYVLLGLAHPRSAWFGEVARWSTAGAAPIDFVKCVSAEEVHARLAAGRVVSALLADADRVANDRDLVDRTQRARCAVLVVDDGRFPRDWRALGVAACLAPSFTRDDLVAALASHAEPVAKVDDEHMLRPAAVSGVAAPWRGALVAVTGTGGTGASTIAMAAAQGMAADTRHRGFVLLADLALEGDLAMLHDARDVVPGVQELVEACRGGTPVEDLDGSVFRVADRGYDLLLGLRRHRDWTAIRPRAFEVAVDTLRRRYRLTVADVDRDIEGEEETGSVDIAERNHIARHTLLSADLVVVVTEHSTKGVHVLSRTVHDLRAGGVEAARIVPVVNRALRSPGPRSEVTKALHALGALAGALVSAPLFVPERRNLDDGLRHAVPLPATLAQTVELPVAALLERAMEMPHRRAEPGPVAAGSLGTWHDTEPGDVA